MAYLVELAEKHVSENELRGKTPIYSANRFVRIVGDIPIAEITQDHICDYRQKCREQKLSPQTIESSIGNIITVLKLSAGRTIETGKPLKSRRPEPRPVEFPAICEVFDKLPAWMQLWIMFSFWTGLRLGDSITCLRKLTGTVIGSVISHHASKTGRYQKWPVPKWLKEKLESVPFPTELCLENQKKQVRAELRPHAQWGPKNLRQCSITEWSKANATAGAIIHGSGLGILNHYVDPLQIIESASQRLRLPKCFNACTQEGCEDTLISNFRRLDPAAQSLIVGTTERLASG